jgi:hypothetical protein
LRISDADALTIPCLQKAQFVRQTRVKVVKVTSAMKDTEIGGLGTAVVAVGIISNPIVLYSEYTLATTGSGLPPGPYGLVGAAEGLSYLAILSIIGWSAYTKVKTGSGLPAGPSGLLGAVEGLSYLSLLAGIAAAAAKFFGE